MTVRNGDPKKNKREVKDTTREPASKVVGKSGQKSGGQDRLEKAKSRLSKKERDRFIDLLEAVHNIDNALSDKEIDRLLRPLADEQRAIRGILFWATLGDIKEKDYESKAPTEKEVLDAISKVNKNEGIAEIMLLSLAGKSPYESVRKAAREKIERND